MDQKMGFNENEIVFMNRVLEELSDLKKNRKNNPYLESTWKQTLKAREALTKKIFYKEQLQKSAHNKS